MKMCCIDHFMLLDGVQCTEMQLLILDDSTVLLTVCYLWRHALFFSLYCLPVMAFMY